MCPMESRPLAARHAPRLASPGGSVLSLAALAALAAMAAMAAAPVAVLAAVASQEPGSELSRLPIREVLRYECASDIGRQVTVLFDDHTVRLTRERSGEAPDGPETETDTDLVTLDPDSYEGFVARLAGEAGPEAGDLPAADAGGAWIASCRLVVSLPGEPVQSHEFRRLDALSLRLSRLVAVAEAVRAHAEEEVPAAALPPGYRPRIGDVLEREDGVRFEIVRETLQGTGWELRGVDEPITEFVPAGQLPRRFVAVVSRAGD